MIALSCLWTHSIKTQCIILTSLLPGQTMKDYNFDNPQALDLDLCEKILSDLLAGKDASIPTYDFCTHKR